MHNEPILEMSDSLDDEQSLIEAARADLTRFAPIYEHYADRVYAYCLRRIQVPQEAEDVTSQIFTKAMLNLHQYHGGAFGAWLFRIARSTLIDHLRQRRPQISLDDLEFSHEDSTLDSIIRREEQQRLRAVVARLPEDQMDLLTLRMVAGLSSAQIGEMLGKSASSVRVALHRLLRQIKQRYEQEQQL